MKALLLSLALFFSIFSIHIEQLENLKRHQCLSSQVYFASVGMVRADGFRGTGTLIHPKVVITAAHIVQNSKSLHFAIEENKKTTLVKGFAVCHPGYVGMTSEKISRNDMDVDLALIFLETPLTKVPCCFLADKQPQGVQPYFITGFGAWNGPEPSAPMDKKLTAVVSIEERTKYLQTVSCLNTSALDLFGSARLGDSGGPLMAIDDHAKIEGLLSCIMHSKVDPTVCVYVSIYPHLKWILETIKEYNDNN